MNCQVLFRCSSLRYASNLLFMNGTRGFLSISVYKRPPSSTCLPDYLPATATTITILLPELQLGTKTKMTHQLDLGYDFLIMAIIIFLVVLHLPIHAPPGYVYQYTHETTEESVEQSTVSDQVENGGSNNLSRTTGCLDVTYFVDDKRVKALDIIRYCKVLERRSAMNKLEELSKVISINRPKVKDNDPLKRKRNTSAQRNKWTWIRSRRTRARNGNVQSESNHRTYKLSILQCLQRRG